MRAIAVHAIDERAARSSALGQEAYALISELYPLCRSLTGDGVRGTLSILERVTPLTRTALKSGTRVFDWEIPKEWNIRDAWVRAPDGRRVIDFNRSNLHVVGYSKPVQTRLGLAALRERIHTLPDRPDWIPYRTSYYREDWGFCASHNLLRSLQDVEYEICIDSTLADGEMLLAESVIPGDEDAEVLVYSHLCHPSLCNDNLSGIVVAALLARELAARPRRRFRYRFVFAPVTIGSIAWLSLNESKLSSIRHGLVLASLGDRGPLTYKRSRRGTADIDRAAACVVTGARGGRIEKFTPYGYDERQFCSPGFDLPVGRLTRTPNGIYPQYHTSADDLTFVDPDALGDSIHACLEIVDLLEANRRYVNTNPKCEPRLGPRGLYSGTQGALPQAFEYALLWLLNQSDGRNDVLKIVEESGLPSPVICSAAEALERCGLLVGAER